MVSGSPPFQATTPLALAEAHRTPPMAIEGASPSLFAIIRPALDPDPALRPASAASLAAELRAWLETDAMPAAADPAAVTEVAIPLPVAVPPVPPPAPGPMSVADGNRAVSALLAKFRKMTKAEIQEQAVKQKWLFSPIYLAPDLLADPQLLARDFWTEVDGLELPGPFAKLSGTPIRYARSAPG